VLAQGTTLWRVVALNRCPPWSGCDGPSCRVSNREREAGSGDALFLAWNFSGDCWRSRRAPSTERFTPPLADSLFRHDRTTQRQPRRGPGCAGSIARRAHRIVCEPALTSSCAGETRSSCRMFRRRRQAWSTTLVVPDCSRTDPFL